MSETVSVIIPIYRVEEYLDACVESVAAQTYKHLQIILVDDGSPDRSGEICDGWKKKDSRITVIHKTNGGLADARNAGLEIAQGKNIVFLDSDDLIAADMIETLYTAMTENDADIAECDYLPFISEIPKTDNRERSVKPYTSEEALTLLLQEKEFKYPVWNKIYRSELLKDIRFETGRLHEDVFFTYQVFGKSRRVVKVRKPLYYYRQRHDSIMGTTFTLRNLDALEARCLQYEYIRVNYPALSKLALRQLLGSCLHMGQKYMQLEDATCRNEGLKRISNIFKMYNGKEELSLNSKEKIWFTLAGISLKQTCKIRNIIGIGL